MLLNRVIQETADNYGLGPKAGALVARTVEMVFDLDEKGFAGFLDRFRQAGQDAMVHSWLDESLPNQPLDGKWLEQVVGLSRIADIGRDLGLANARVRTAMAFVVPELVGVLVRDGRAPEAMPSEVRHYLDSAAVSIAPRTVARPTPTARRREGSRTRKGGGPPAFWTWGTAILVVSALLMAQHLWRSREKPQPNGEPKSQPASVVAKEPAPELDRPAARLILRNLNGRIVYSGSVNAPGIRTAIVEKLKSAYTPERLEGHLAVNPLQDHPVWLSGLDRVLPLMETPGFDLQLDGQHISLGGWLEEGNRQALMTSVRTVFGTGYNYDFLGESEELALARETQSRILVTLMAMDARVRGQDLVRVLNHWPIPFAAGSALFPEEAVPIAQRTALIMKNMNWPFVMGIRSRVESSGDAPRDRALSLARANAVAGVLVEAGTPAWMLKTAGLGALDPASGQRSVEFVRVQECDQTHPCGLTPGLTETPEPVNQPPLAPEPPVVSSPVEQPVVVPAQPRSAEPPESTRPPVEAPPEAPTKPSSIRPPAKPVKLHDLF